MKTLRSRMLFGYLGLTLVMISLVVAFNYRFFQKRDSINRITSDIESLYTLFLKDTRIISELFRSDLHKPELFLNDSTDLLIQHHLLMCKVNESKSHDGLWLYFDAQNVKNKFQDLHQSFYQYGVTIELIITNIRERGFKDFGIEGEMRKYIHKLETFPMLNQSEILTLRRHEKDYIIRNDDIYIDKLNRLTDKLLDDIKSLDFHSSNEKDTVVFLLTSYRNSFHRMVEIDNIIGIRKNSGLKASLNQQIFTIDENFNKILNSIQQNKDLYMQKLRREYIIFFLLLGSIVIFIGFFFAHNTTKPLSVLVEHVNEFVTSNFTVNRKVMVKNIPQEVQELISSFNNMVDQLNKRELARVNAESKIIETENKFRELAELLPVGIFETDEKGFFQFVNRAWVKSFGYTKRDIRVKMNFSQVITKQDFYKLFNGYKTNYVECSAIRKDGSTFSEVLITNEVVKGNERKGIRGIIIDNTERKKIIDALKAEKLKAQQSDKLKTAFLANMSHEIRTPMNAIIGFSSLLAEMQSINSNQREYLDIIKRSGEHLLNLIDDIIDIAKIESGGLSINIAKCNLYSLVQEVAVMFSNKLNMSNKSDVEVQIKNSLPKTLLIQTDSLRVKQVMVNLMANALKFTHNGYIELGAEIDNHENIVIYVKDTGIGIDKKNLNSIFEAFRQANDEISQTYGGNGLGLTISKNLVTLLGGTIWVDSIVGEGSTFSFSIPYNPVFELKEELPLFNSFTEIIDNRLMLDDVTVLVAEDDEASYIFLREYLSRFNLRILRAKDGNEVIDICKNNIIDLVFMDIHMPKLNGYEATGIIKSFKPQLPIIAQTAYALSGEKEKCLSQGFSEYLPKPISLEEVNMVIYKYLCKRENLIWQN